MEGTSVMSKMVFSEECCAKYSWDKDWTFIILSKSRLIHCKYLKLWNLVRAGGGDVWYFAQMRGITLRDFVVVHTHEWTVVAGKVYTIPEASWTGVRRIERKHQHYTLSVKRHAVKWWKSQFPVYIGLCYLRNNIWLQMVLGAEWSMVDSNITIILDLYWRPSVLTVACKNVSWDMESVFFSSGSSGRVRGGPRNMKSMRLPLAAIFFMTYFHRARGGPWPPRPPPWIRYWFLHRHLCFKAFRNLRQFWH